jgi:hypothetical protein
MGDGHPHPACTVYGIEVNKADLLALWPGPLKRASKRTSIARLVRQAEASGHPVGSITTRDGITVTFGEGESAADNEVENWFRKQRRHADQR